MRKVLITVFIILIIIFLIGVLYVLSNYFNINKKTTIRKLLKKSYKEILMKDKKNLVKRDYKIYVMSPIEQLKYSFFGIIFGLAIGYIFYQAIWAMVIGSLVGSFYFKLKYEVLLKNQKIELKNQFKEGLYALSGALSAGVSLEESFASALEDLDKDKNYFMAEEFLYFCHALKLNSTVEEVLLDFKARAGIDEIDHFVDILIVSKRTEGNLNKVIKNTSGIINEKIEIANEIEVLLAQKKIEQKVLCLMPIGILVFLSNISMDYMTPLFTTIAGRIIMTLALVLLGVSYKLSSRIMNIEV